MANQIVKLELPSGRSEMHLATIKKDVTTIDVEPGSYKEGDILGISAFTLSVPNEVLHTLGFTSFEVLNTYVLLQANNEVKSKLTYRIDYTYTATMIDSKAIMGKVTILCKNDITTNSSFSIIPGIISKALLSNCSTTQGTYHIIEAS